MLKWIGAAIVGVLAVFAAALLLTLLIIKALWAWTIPDLFPGAVASGDVAGTISWYTALKVAIFVAFLAGMAQGSRTRKCRQDGTDF
jgi:hypothetical protein